MKKSVALLIIIFAVIVFTALAIFIDPYIICFVGQVLHDKWQIICSDNVVSAYDWSLRFITLVLCVITFVLFRRSRLRIYAFSFIFLFISLIISMFYTGITYRDYIGDGFTCVSNFSSGFYYRSFKFCLGYNYRNSKGEIILTSSERLRKEHRNGAIVFQDLQDDMWNRIKALYNENGDCFLRIPEDDEKMNAFSDFYYSEKSYYEDGSFDHDRIRFFDKDGNYMITREYGSGGYHPHYEINGELLSEYREEVDELPDGVKIFKAE